MGGDVSVGKGTTIPQCFNPRPRMGGDFNQASICILLSVSIHAPAWGATL